MSIQKIIHYCWLSDEPIPEIYQTYMKSWKIKLPDYKFILWDTKRFDINTTIWTKQAFDAKLYACAADYIRLYAVYNCGGIYLDMDMEVIKPFDSLLNSEIMIAYENHISENIEAGCFGAEKEHPYIRKCMEYFENKRFFNPLESEKIMLMPVSERHEYINPLILPEIMSIVLKQHFKNIAYKIYPKEYFTAKNVVTGQIEKKEVTFTVHHFATQYHSEEWRKRRAVRQRINRTFGENAAIVKTFEKLYGVTKRINSYGIAKAAMYYFDKYIRKPDTINA
ncbi:MAG: glycosyl transferase [Spirochaetaceae bacterium]|jgi:mannosyltransferase OCH1-like enzyme|nr:glycosyl transferase [Spirochaetaceae bacterium]